MYNPIGVVGSDGFTPLYEPDKPFRILGMNDVYLGKTGKFKYIPNINDYVVEPETASFYRVVNLNNVTFIPELIPVVFNTSSINGQSLLATDGENYRVYYDKSVKPYTLTIDGMFKVYGSEASYARIYKGYFITSEGLISRLYNNSGGFVGSDIPLVKVLYNSHDNYAVKSPTQVHTDNQDLVSGEVVTIVVYSTNGSVIKKEHAIIEETTFVPQNYAEQKYITQIYLKSSFINLSDTNRINYPVNLPIESFNPIGVVVYSDGSELEYPVTSNGPFRIDGLDQFVAGSIGQEIKLALNYRLDEQESGLATGDYVVNNGFIARPYSLLVVEPNTSYNVKVFAYPVWVSGSSGYRLQFFMLNLDRNVIYDVTSVIKKTITSNAFNPTRYGVSQRLFYTLDLSEVSPVYGKFNYVQGFEIKLNNQATVNSSYWEVASQVPNNGIYYGSGLKATIPITDKKILNIKNTATTLAEFLNITYKKTFPLVNPMTEAEPLTPTHIKIFTDLNTSVTIAITDYNKPITFPVDLIENSNINMLFLRKHGDVYFNLSVCSMVVKVV